MLNVDLSMESSNLELLAVCVSQEQPQDAPLPTSFSGEVARDWKSL